MAATATTESRREVNRYALLGLMTFALYGGLEVFWTNVVAALVGRSQIGLDEQPLWAVGAKAAVDISPWATYAGLLVSAIARRRWRPLVAFTGGQALGVFALIASLFAAPIVSDYATRVPFDSLAWKAENKEERTGIRVRMVDDLLRWHKLEGMSTGQVESLLGVPSRTQYFREYDYVYWLGPERGFLPIDSEWLVLKCEAGVVVSAKIVTD